MSADLKELARLKIEAQDKYNALAMAQRPIDMVERVQSEIALQVACVAYNKASDALYVAVRKAGARS